MKSLLLINVCVLAIALVQGSPLTSKQADLQEFINEALEQTLDGAVQDEDQGENEEDKMTAELQELFAAEQSTDAEIQGFWKKLWKGAKKLVKKGIKVGKKLYNVYNRVKGCAVEEDMPEELEDAAVEAFLAKEQKALLQSLQKEAQTSSSENEDEDMSAELQKFLAEQQSPVATQGFFKKLWRGAKKFVKKAIKYGRKAYQIYNKVKNGGSCAQAAEISEELEDAVAQAFIAQEQDALKFAAIVQLLE